MAEFFVAKEQTTEQEGHLVHDKDCSHIAPVEDFKYLGSFATKEAAFKKAAGYFYTVNYCPSCLATAAKEAEAAA
ncbi:hypothetical protein [Halioxenophilus sp. WMMB6]|uniref:hypothetical protein n=1 Tax=Halioxenophilus sp. WMMB6 TaxID=3073815 RepID=UPI00295E2E21|nr:hypothetical protein [Halioxenophilus sp. WMMB6]